jgi:hypothetical protein
MPEEAVLDSPAIDVAAPETPVVDSGAPETPEVGVDTPETPVEGQERQAAQEQIDGRTLSPEMRKLLGEIKTTNPKLEKQSRGLVCADKQFKEKFPGGLAEAVKLQTKFAELGGEEGIADLATARQELKSIDESAERGDPNFIDSVIEQFPDAFPKLVTHAVNKWADVDPQGYQHQMAQIFVSTLSNGGVLNQLYRMSLALEMNNANEAKKIVGEINEWMDGIGKIARTAPTKATKQGNPQLDEREKTVAQREANLFHQDVGREVDSFVKDTLFKEIEKYTKTKLTPDQQEAAWELGQGRLTSALRANQGYLSTSGRFAQARDKAGLVKLNQVEMPKAIRGPEGKTTEGIAYKVFKILFSNGMGKPTPKPAPANGAVKVAPKPAEGWKVITERPKPYEIDRRRTSDDDILAHRYILKNGQKVMLSA